MLDLLLPWAFALGLLIPMRSLEGWLHQHMFKVGWLLTKNLHTTTILYYTFFLPGVVLHEVLVWLVAGMLNVRAEGAIKMPEKQEIAALKLNFVKLDKKVSQFKLAVISIAPLIGGIVFIWFVTNNIFDIGGFLEIASSGELEDIGAAFSRLTATPDFWLWMYLVFAVSATMIPDAGNLRGWRLVIPPIVVVIILLYAIGVGDRVLLVTLQSLSQGAYFLMGTFGVVIVVHLVMTGILGAIESIIERITGDSATFEKGKLVAMRRDEILKMRAEQAAKAQKSLATRDQSADKKTARAAASGPPSIYRLPLPIPGTPDKEGLHTPEVVVSKETQGTLPGAKGSLPPAAASAPVINPPRSIPTSGVPATSPTQSSSEPAASTSESPRVPDAARPTETARPSPFAPSSPAKPAASADTSEVPTSGSPRPPDTVRPAPFAPTSPAKPDGSPDSTGAPASPPRPSPFAPPKPADATAEVPAVGAPGTPSDKPASPPLSRPAVSTFGQQSPPARSAASAFGARPPLDDDEEDEDDGEDEDEDEI